jgi:hypothetical protein
VFVTPEAEPNLVVNKGTQMKQGMLDQQGVALSVRRFGTQILLSLLALFITVADARPVAEDVARRVALNFAQQHIATTGSWEGSQRVEVESISQVVFDGKAVAHLVRTRPTGYLLVSADDDLPPVIVYSPNGKFDPLEAANFGSLESWILPETRTRLESISAKRNESIAAGEELTFESLRSGSEVARAWEFFDVDQGAFVPFQSRFLEKTTTIDGQFKAGSVGPLLRTTWNQGEDRAPYTYNLYAPAGPTCGRTVTGCVATAAAQILRYWSWPDRGTGTASYTWNGQTLSTSFQTTYNWAAMPNNLTSSSGSTAIDAVARLMSDVGIAFRMSYGCGSTGGSGAVTADVISVFPTYFKYQTGIRAVSRSSTAAGAFFDTLRSELDAVPPRPALFSMRSSSGGHAVVVDGYVSDVTNRVSINMGWGGYANAFYDISSDWAGGGISWWASSQNAYVNIRPTNVGGGGGGTTCSFAIGQSSATVAASGGSVNVSLTTSSGCTWGTSNSASWVTVSPSGGSGSATITLSASANPSSSARSTTVSLAGRSFVLTQLGTSCSFSLSSSALSFNSGGGSSAVSVGAASGCGWIVSGDASIDGASPWLSATPRSGTGTGSVTITAQPNTSGATRVGYVFIGGQTITVTQTGSCTYDLFPSQQTIASNATGGSFNMQTSSACTWTAQSNASWLTLTSASSGIGSTLVTYSATPNTGTSSRVGTISIGREVFTVTQNGTSPVVSTSLQNGDFEQGRTIWSEMGSQIIYNDPARSRGGYWFAWLGGYDNANDVLTQTITLPSAAATIGVRYGYRVETSEVSTSIAYDTLTLNIRTSGGQLIGAIQPISNLNASSSWQLTSLFDLSAYKGQAIQLQFVGTTDASANTNFFVDDVELVVGGVSCSVSVNPVSATVSSDLSSLSFNITTSPSTGCPWSATSNASWLTFPTGAGGSGSATLRVSAAQNSGNSRVGTIQIGAVTITVTQGAPATQSSIIKNGEFESGRDPWTETSGGGFPVVQSTSRVSAKSGVAVAWFGGYNAAVDTLSQTFTIPASLNSAMFSFWYQVSTSEISSLIPDNLTVELQDAPTGAVLLTLARITSQNVTSGWTQSPLVDLVQYKGRLLKLVFRANTDNSNATSFFVDSIKIDAIGPGGTSLSLLQRGGIDIDGDGLGEIVLRSAAGAVISGRYVGNQLQFTQLPDPGPGLRLMAAVDVNADGKSDLVLLNTDTGGTDIGGAIVWFGFDNNRSLTLRTVRTSWRVDAAGDLDGDGRGDIVWRFTGNSGNPDDTGVSYIWFSDGTSVAQVRKRGGAPLSWTLLGATDMNADGAADMVYISPTNAVRILMATPNRTCANLSGGTLPAGQVALRIGSFSGVGKSDVLLRDPITGVVSILSYDARGIVLPPYAGVPDDPNASCTSSPLSVPVVSTVTTNITTDPQWRFLAASDLNGDGIQDVVWQDPTGRLIVWIMGIDGVVSIANSAAGTASVGVSAVPR